MSRYRCVGAAIAAWMLTAGGVFADTIWVPDDYATIQGAIDAAVDGDEIAVRPGTYNETIDFIGKAVRLYSTDGPEVTVIDAEYPDPPESVVTCSSGEGPETSLEGFTVTGGMGTGGGAGGMLNIGSSPTVTNCTFSRNFALEAGGMANYDNGSPTVTNCTFSGNYAMAWNGGGMLNDGSSSPTVTNCTFSGNSAENSGGGMFNGSSSSPTVTNCTFSGNTAQSRYGGGGGMYNDGSSPTVTNCAFSGNAGRYGGGMWNGASPTVTNCTFDGNEAQEGGGMWNGASPTVTNCTFDGNEAQEGGGMFNFGSPTVTDCTFSGNTANQGGGMFNFGSDPTVTDCTFSGNSAGSGGGMYNFFDSSPTVTNCTFITNSAPNGRAIACDGFMPSHLNLANCILWDGGDEIWNNDGSTIIITYSDIHGGYEGIGNIDADPLCDADGRPQAGSPCIDAGVNNAVAADTLDLDGDGDTSERLPFDLDGNPRFADDLDREDTGCGLPVVVDMGAFEYQGIPVHPILIGDVDGSGFIDFADLLDILAGWGQCHDDCCLADVNFDREVNFEDILLLLSNWS